MNIKIISYRKLDSGKLKGVAQIKFEDIGLTVNGVKVIETKKGGHFYAFPSEKYIDKDTQEEKYRDHCGFYDKGVYHQFYESMTRAFTEYFKSGQQPTQYQPATSPAAPHANIFDMAQPNASVQDEGVPF